MNKTAWVIVAGAAIITFAMGVRSTFGIFMLPLSAEHGVSITVLSLSLAVQNLVWGMVQPVAGALSDRHGAGRVIAFGGVLYALGLYVAVSFSEPVMIILGAGILIGLAQSCTTFAVVLGVIGRRVSEQRRPMALGIASAGGSFGQMSIIPMAQSLMEVGGFEFSLLCLAALAFIVVPLAVPMAGKPTEEAAGGVSGPKEA